MTESGRFALLAEVARLIKKYGPDEFVELARFLNDPAGLGQLTSVLEAGSKAGRDAHIGKRTPRPAGATPGLSGFIASLEKIEPDKAKRLSEFVRQVRGKTVLPSLRDIRDFAADNGLHPVTASSREKALFPLIRDLAARTAEDVDRVLAKVPTTNQDGDRTLDKWAGVILRKDRPHAQE